MQPITPPKTMLAWTHTSRGPPSQVLHLTENNPIRYPKKPNEILVKISYAALNPGGSILLHFVPFFFRHSPAVPELDFSGTIVQVGPSDSTSPGHDETESLLDRISDRGLLPGAKVFGSIHVPEHIGAGHGSLAEYLLVDSSCLVLKPDNVSFEEAAGLSVAGSTALALVESAKIKPSDKVLVNGGSGGIGSLVVQLVKSALGDSGSVVAVCSERNRDFVSGFGAEVVSYDASPPVTSCLAQHHRDRKFDVVIDAHGIQEIWDRSPAYLKEDGLFVTAGIAIKNYTISSMMRATWLMMVQNPLNPLWLGGVPRKYVRVTAFVTLDRLKELAKLAEEAKVKVAIDSIWGMEDAKQAYRVLLSKRARGKVIVKIDD